MPATVVAYGVSLVTFVVVDLIWLGMMASRFYKPTLGDMALHRAFLPPAIAFYLIYPLGLVIFAVEPATRSGSALAAIVSGALFGFFTYATYDLTNHATLRNWSLSLTVIDIMWGTLLGAVVSYVAFTAVQRLPGTG
jgi:uncharacterized membrane protein